MTIIMLCNSKFPNTRYRHIAKQRYHLARSGHNGLILRCTLPTVVGLLSLRALQCPILDFISNLKTGLLVRHIASVTLPVEFKWVYWILFPTQLNECCLRSIILYTRQSVTAMRLDWYSQHVRYLSIINIKQKPYDYDIRKTESELQCNREYPLTPHFKIKWRSSYKW